MAEDLRLKLELTAKDGLSGIIKSATRASDDAFARLQKRMDKTAETFDKFGKKSLVIGAGLTATAGIAVKSAADFQTSMRNVSTLIDTNTENLSDIEDKVLQIGKRTPVALNDLTEGLYNIRSAGMEASQQFTILEKSAQLGIAGLGSTNEAVDLVTSSINAWQLEGAKAEKVYDLIFRTVKTGKTTISGIAQGFGAVAGTVAAAGIELDDYLASVAALTTTGQPAAQAHTQIKAAISGMTRESKESQKVFKQLGAMNFKDLVQKSGGMVNAFAKITSVVKGNDAMILKLFGSTEAYNAVVGLAGKQNKAYIETLKGMRDGTNAVDEAYLKQAETLNSAMQTVKNTISKISIDFGTGLLPAVTQISKGIVGFSNVIDKIPQPLKSAIAIGVAGTGLLLTGLGTTSILIGSSIRGFKDMMSVYREASVWLWAHNIKMNNIQLDMRKGFTNGFNLFKSGFGSVKSGIVNFIPNCKNATLSMIAFTKSAPSMFWKGLNNGLNTIKNGFINFIPNCKKAIAAMRSFNIVMSLNPIGLITAGIIAGGFLIYKYWKPITSFFKGFYLGLKEGLAPLSPMFKKLGEAFQPLTNALKSFFTPVQTDGTKALEWGKKFGSMVADWINKLIEACKWAKNLVTFGGKIHFGGGNKESQHVDGSHANGLDRVPKDGYIAKLHKDESVLTSSESEKWRNIKKGNMSQSVVINYAPVTNLPVGANKSDFAKELQRHKRELIAILEEFYKRRNKVSYA